MKNNTNMTPKLRFPEFTDEWQVKKLGDVGPVSMCKRIFNNQTKPSGDIPFYKIGTFGKTPDAFIDSALYEQYKRKYSFPNKGDILISAAGTIGRLVVYDGLDAYFQDSNIVWIANDEAIVSNKFLHYCYLRVDWKTEDTTIARLYNNNLRNIGIKVPSPIEQEKIAGFLTVVDDRVAAAQQKVELLKKYKKGVMQALFSGKLRFKDENGNPYPNWQEKRLGELIDIGSSKRVLQKDWKDAGVPFYRTREIINLAKGEEFRTPIFISEELYKKLSKQYGVPQPGDMLVTGVGTIGANYLVQEGDQFYFKDGNVLWFKQSEKLDPIFLFQAFQTRFIQKQIANNASITTVATYTIDGAKKTIIRVPMLEEQQKIANFLTTLDDKIKLEEANLASSKEFKKGLLRRMFV